MPHITIPRDVSSDVQRAFQETNRELNRMDIPLLESMESVRGIQERGAALYFEDDQLCLYRKINGKLYCIELSEVE